MKRSVLVLFVVLAGISAAFADVCPSSTLDNYLGSGFSCGINDTTYSDFSYAYSSNPGGFGIPASAVSVSPISTSGNPGFLFSAPWSVSNNSGVLAQNSLLGYSVTVNQGGAPITDLTLAMVGFDAIGTGEITINETYCLGGILPLCTGGTEGSLSLNYTSSGGSSSKTVNFSGVDEISLQEGILLTSGTNGQAAVSGIYNQFSQGQVPEPGSMVLFGTGVLGLVGVLRRKLGF